MCIHNAPDTQCRTRQRSNAFRWFASVDRWTVEASLPPGGFHMQVVKMNGCALVSFQERPLAVVAQSVFSGYSLGGKAIAITLLAQGSGGAGGGVVRSKPAPAGAAVPTPLRLRFSLRGGVLAVCTTLVPGVCLFFTEPDRLILRPSPP